jgi:hypothetical protein
MKNIVLIVPVFILLMIFPDPVKTAVGFPFADHEAQAIKISVQDHLHDNLRELSEKNKLAYTLVLAVYQIDTEHKVPVGDIEKMIKELADYRDYWSAQGYSDEMVFDLILLSRQRGIDGCNRLIESRDSLENDRYVQEVTMLKYELDQIEAIGWGENLLMHEKNQEDSWLQKF